MSVPPKKDRRAVPRYQVKVACSVLVHSSDQRFRGQAVLGQVKDLSRHAVAVLLPTNETYGVDALGMEKRIQLTLALPVGYVRLSASLIRYKRDESGKYFFVFRIQESDDRGKYDEYLDALEAELSGAAKDSYERRLTLIETKLDPN
ncbi:MAG: PilZ domain-containing protein [bacterium]